MGIFDIFRKVEEKPTLEYKIFVPLLTNRDAVIENIKNSIQYTEEKFNIKINVSIADVKEANEIIDKTKKEIETLPEALQNQREQVGGKIGLLSPNKSIVYWPYTDRFKDGTTGGEYNFSGKHGIVIASSGGVDRMLFSHEVAHEIGLRDNCGNPNCLMNYTVGATASSSAELCPHCRELIEKNKTKFVPFDSLLKDNTGTFPRREKSEESQKAEEKKLEETPKIEKEKLAEVVINNKTLYHGSMTPGIKELQAAEENTVGQGAYLTSQEEAAKGYAIKRADEYKGSPTLYEVNVDNAKLIDLRDTKTLDKIFQGFNEFLKEKLKQGSLSWRREGVARSVIERISQKHYSTGTIKFTTENCGDWFSEYLQPKGYDGLIALEGGEGNIGDHDTYLFFNTSKPKITKEINLQPNERPELIAAAEAIEYKQEERKFEEKELKDNKKEMEITNEYIISSIANGIYGQNSCSHVVDCALTSAGYLYSYSQMLKATKYNNSEISRQLEDLADSDILLSKLMIAISSSKTPTKLYQELVEKAMSYSPKFLNYLEESEKKEAETCLKNFRSAHTLVDVTTNFNRLLYLERDGFAIAHNKKDSKLPEDLEKLRIASNENFSKKLTLESYDFLSSFDPDLSRDIFSRDTLSKDKIITSDEYSFGIRGLSFLHPKINPSLEEIKESQKKEKLQPETAQKTSNAEQATLATTTALALPTTKAIQLITKGAVQPIRCTTCNKVFGSDAEFYNNQIHPCVRVRLKCPVCGSEDVD